MEKRKKDMIIRLSKKLWSITKWLTKWLWKFLTKKRYLIKRGYWKHSYDYQKFYHGGGWKKPAPLFSCIKWTYVESAYEKRKI